MFSGRGRRKGDPERGIGRSYNFFFLEVIQGGLDGIKRKSISEGVNEEKALPAVSMLKTMELDDTDSKGGGLQYVGDGKECVSAGSSSRNL